MPKRARFQALCQALRPDLLRFAFWLSRDHSVAEDVVQETMLRAWKAQDSLADEAAAKPWFLTIIRREYARTFERKRFDTVDVDALVASEEPLLAAEEAQDLAELRRAVFRLPDDYRVPLVLQVLMGYTTAEIAARARPVECRRAHPPVPRPTAAAGAVRGEHPLGSRMTIVCAALSKVDPRRSARRGP